MKRKKNLFTVFLLIYFSFLYADISFLSADLKKSGDILFSVKSGFADNGSYDTLFLYSEKKDRAEPLTFFAEKIDFIKELNSLQLVNRFGIMRLNINTKQAELLEYFSPFTAQNYASRRYSESVSTSPDGRWLTVIEPVSPVHGRLVLIDTVTEKRHILIEKTVINMNPVSWSADSKTLLYEESSVLYFARPEWFISGSPVNKRFRQLGKGSIKNVRWISANEFIFLSGTIFFKVNSSELFTKSFYYPLFQPGQFAGRLPAEPNSDADFISVSPNGKTAVFINAKRNVFYLNLYGSDFSDKEADVLYLSLPGNTAEVSVFWKNNKPVLFSASILNGKTVLTAWQISTKGQFEKALTIQEGSVFSVSPDFKITIIKENGLLSFYDTGTWKKTAGFTEEQIVSAAWKNAATLFLGGKKNLYRCTLTKDGAFSDKEILNLTSAEDYSFSETGDTVLAKTSGGAIAEYASPFVWKKTAQNRIFDKKNSNADERIYIDSGLGYFKNMIYIRSLKDFTTKPLFQEPPAFALKLTAKRVDRFANSSFVFSHGSRNGKKQIAFVFDAVDDMEGTAEVLHVLNKHGIKATFFINGEALKRNPYAVKEIVKNGHSCGSLFFTAWNLTGSDYTIDEAFIKQGLAKNEDSFYAVTGKELSLIWHTPDYITSQMIVSAGKKAGYIFISPDIQNPDWIDTKTGTAVPQLYKSSPELIEDIYANVNTGSIIPIRLGGTDIKRRSYLYEHLKLLIEVLQEAGYYITDVKNLMQDN